MTGVQLFSDATLAYFTARNPARHLGLADLEAWPAQWRLTDEALESLGIGAFNVRHYGATGDGTSDDTTAVQAAITAAVAFAATYGGATIYFPAGIYRIASTLTVSQAGVKFVGEGITTSVLKFTAASTETGPLVKFTAAVQLNGCGMSNMEIDGLYDGGQTTSEGCLKLFNIRWFRLDNVRVRNSAGYGLMTDTDYAAGVTTNQSNFYNRVYSFQNQGTGQHYQGEKNSQWSMLRSEQDCQAGTDGTGGIVWEATSTGTIRETTECSVTNVRVNDSGRFGMIWDSITKYSIGSVMIHGSQDSAILLRHSNVNSDDGVLIYNVMSTFVLRNNAKSATYLGYAGIETATGGAQFQSNTLIGWEVVGDNQNIASPGVFDMRGWQEIRMIGVNVRSHSGTAFHIYDGVLSDGSTGNAAGEIKFIGCDITNSNASSTAATNHGIFVETSAVDTTRNIFIEGCYLSNSLTDGSTAWEVYIEAGVEIVTIMGCHLDAATDGGEIGIESGAEDEVRVHGCSFRTNNSAVGSVASAATITIPPDSLNGLCNVTGTADITGITPAAAGTTAILKFNGTAAASGLVDGSNLKLASTLAYTADDTISLVCNGTNWYETGRSVN